MRLLLVVVVVLLCGCMEDNIKVVVVGCPDGYMVDKEGVIEDKGNGYVITCEEGEGYEAMVFIPSGIPSKMKEGTLIDNATIHDCDKYTCYLNEVKQGND